MKVKNAPSKQRERKAERGAGDMNRRLTVGFAVLVLGLVSFAWWTSSDPKETVPDQTVTIEQLPHASYGEGLSYDEMIWDKQKIGLPLDDQPEEPQGETGTFPAQVRYYKLAMEDYHVANWFRRYTLTPVFYVGLSFSDPTGTPDQIVSLNGAYVSTEKGNPCAFQGRVFYKLETGRQFFYGVSGDTYEPGLLDSPSAPGRFLQNVSFDDRFYTAELKP